jgi:uncharacterized protein
MRAHKQLVERQTGVVLCDRCELAESFPRRLRGLLGRGELGAGEGLFIRPAPSVHTFFMRFPIDVVFVDGDLRVLRVVERLGPWRAAGCRGAKAVFELPAGDCRRKGIGDGASLRLTTAAVAGR